ncbi:MAG TPA: MBL fold metallo-hydrolase [Vicinamibacterales bacterium]|nr:MBL fold metallo-hydrolase [Vicinamibacterales bacterium]
MPRLVLLVSLLVLVANPTSARDLQIYFIDVEGGQATLIVTPAGESLLIDAGYGGNRGSRDPDRILAAIADAGIDRIDYLVITHFHNDHVGGVPELAARIPIGTFIDYGEPLGTDRMAVNGFRAYEPVRADRKHLVPRPGDRLALAGLDVEVVSVSGELVSQPLAGGGQSNAGCATLENHVEDGTENVRSIGLRLQMGAFRFVALGDLSGNTLGKLVCPTNLLGRVSAYLVAHHGNYDSNVPAMLTALQPQVAILNNSAVKGGAPDSLRTLGSRPDMDLWQLHASHHPDAKNAADDFIANVDEGETAYWIKLTAEADGRFELMNRRTGFRKNYHTIYSH